MVHRSNNTVFQRGLSCPLAVFRVVKAQVDAFSPLECWMLARMWAAIADWLYLILSFQSILQLKKMRKSNQDSEVQLMALLNEYDYYDYTTSSSSFDSDDSF
jgi:hypothetical protein